MVLTMDEQMNNDIYDELKYDERNNIYKMNDEYLQGEWWIFTRWMMNIYKVNDEYLQDEWWIFTKWMMTIYRMNNDSFTI